MIANYFWHGIHVKQALILFTFLIVHLFIIIFLFYLFFIYKVLSISTDSRRKASATSLREVGYFSPQF